MTTRQDILACGNTEVPAYLELIRLGYEVTCNLDWPGGPMWAATTTELNLTANSLVAVLGLHFMRTIRGVKWQATDDEIDAWIERYQKPFEAD